MSQKTEPITGFIILIFAVFMIYKYIKKKKKEEIPYKATTKIQEYANSGSSSNSSPSSVLSSSKPQKYGGK